MAAAIQAIRGMKRRQESEKKYVGENDMDSYFSSFPISGERIRDIQVGVLFNGYVSFQNFVVFDAIMQIIGPAYRTWKSRRMAYTNEVIVFTRGFDDEEILDVVPLAEIVGVEDMDGKGPQDENKEQDDSEPAELSSFFASALQIRTMPHGYNRFKIY